LRKDEKELAISKIDAIISELFIDFDFDEKEITDLFKNCLKNYDFTTCYEDL